MPAKSRRTSGSFTVEDIDRVGVMGGGLMGRGIAQVVALAGYKTTLIDLNRDILEDATAAIEKSLGRLVEKEKISADDREGALARIVTTTLLDDLGNSDLVIEAVTEDLELKNDLWRQLDELCSSTAVFASNTSSLTIAAMAAATRRPNRFVGLHFFNPVPVMKLVEVVRTVTTEPSVFDVMIEFVKSLSKEPVEAKDTSGFIVNLLLVPYLLDAIRALESGVGSVEDIDKGMTLGTGHPMGPFQLLDFVGLDTTQKIAEIMFDEYREKRYAPPPLLRRMVTAKMYGRKSGLGFYDYSTDPATVNDLGL